MLLSKTRGVAMQCLALLLIALLSAITALAKEKEVVHIPTLLLHGINNEPRSWRTFIETIDSVRQAKGTKGRLIAVHSPFDGVPGSWLALREQVKWFRKHIQTIIALEAREFEDGFDLVCHSQGAVICRALCQEYDDLPVKSFISLAGPQLGVYGGGFFPEQLFPAKFRNVTVENIWKLAYEKWAQDTLSPANLWHDPKHHRDFLQKNTFLPRLLGLAGDAWDLLKMKQNFVRLEKAVFLVGNLTSTYDKGIDPWISGVMGYYDKDGKVVEVWDQPFFINDTFGLRTLYETGRLVINAVPDVLHDDWIFDSYVIRTFIMPHLSKPRSRDVTGGEGIITPDSPPDEEIGIALA